jgi:hypothetical protein
MTKTFDELMKILEEKGTISEEEGANLIKEHGALTDEEKKNLAAALRMKRALSKDAPKPADGTPATDEEVSMDDYLQALSVLDSEAASAEDKANAQTIKEKFESQ